MLRHEVRERVVLADAHDDDEVLVAGHGVDLGHAFDIGEFSGEVGHAAGLGRDEHERGDHGGGSSAPG